MIVLVGVVVQIVVCQTQSVAVQNVVKLVVFVVIIVVKVGGVM